MLLIISGVTGEDGERRWKMMKKNEVKKMGLSQISIRKINL